MTRKRTRKKPSTLLEAELLSLTNSQDSEYSLHKWEVAIPCPECAHGTLNRTYVPAMGNMNGTVSCPRCSYQAPYVSALARTMDPTDPLPPGFFDSSIQSRVVIEDDGFWISLRKLARRVIFGGAAAPVIERRNRVVYHTSLG